MKIISHYPTGNVLMKIPLTAQLPTFMVVVIIIGVLIPTILTTQACPVQFHRSKYLQMSGVNRKAEHLLHKYQQEQQLDSEVVQSNTAVHHQTCQRLGQPTLVHMQQNKETLEAEVGHGQTLITYK